jgi:hypothetical protein
MGTLPETETLSWLRLNSRCAVGAGASGPRLGCCSTLFQQLHECVHLYQLYFGVLSAISPVTCCR